MTFDSAFSKISQRASFWGRLVEFWPPLTAFWGMCAFILLTPPRDLTPGFRTPPEVLAHNLGHGINSFWVASSLMLLVFPALWAKWKHGQPAVWAWRALDAALLDFLVVDAIGKRFFVQWARPGNAHHALVARPGFPSGHSTFAFLLAWLIWQRFPRLGPLWFGMAALIGWSRIENHAHFPYQVIVGAVIGCALGALVTARRSGVLVPRIFLSDARLRALLGADADYSQLETGGVAR